MTYAHLLFAVATAAYILIAIQFEERDLIREYGSTYAEYRRTVPMLIPFTRGRAAARTGLAQKVGTAAFVLFLFKGLVWVALAGAALW